MNLSAHEDCSVYDRCEAGDPSSCPRQPAREKRERDRQGGWSPLELGRDGGGNRHFLDGKPVHCGTFIELQAVEYRSDDYGDYTAPLQRGDVVRYEARLISGAPVTVTLYAGIGGHTFTAELNPSMRFRWPR